MKHIFIVLLLIAFSSPLMATSSLDVRTEFENWNSGIKGKASAIVFGLGGSHVLNSRWSVSGGIVTGSHSFSDNDNTASRQDLDLAIAYAFKPAIRIYGGYRLIRLSYTEAVDNARSFNDLTHGLGIGIAAYQAIQPKLYAYGRVGVSALFSAIDFEGLPDDSGSGFGGGVEGGLIYQWRPRTNAGFSIKQQSSAIDYSDQTESWSHNYLRIGLSLSHTF